MRRKPVLLIGCSFLLHMACAAQRPASPADAVNPLVGTAKEGQTFPGVGVPFGMTMWTPATSTTEKKAVTAYYYKDPRITGFRGTHFMSGSAAQEFGSFQVLAGTGIRTIAEASSAYSHQAEVSTPYRYEVDLPDLHVHTTMTGTARCGLMSFRFVQAGPAWISLENLARAGDGELTIDPVRGEITGRNAVRRLYQGAGKLAGFSGYAVVQFDRPVQVGGTWSGGATHPGQTRQEADAGPSGAWVSFNVSPGETVQARVGTSFISVDEARRNLHTELPAWDFPSVERASHEAWDRDLGRIEISAPETDRRVFYTALYHAFQVPRIVTDVSGTRPRFASGAPTRSEGHEYYDDFSMWDIFRAQMPLLSILDPKREGEMIQSLVEKGTEGGFMPIFPMWNSYTSEMIGDHADAVIADAYMKGIRNFNVEKAYALMRQNAFDQPATVEQYKDGLGRRALDDYIRLGYIPLENGVPDAFHKREQVSRTLEYAYDDFALAQMAEALGKTGDAVALTKRTQNYRNVIDPETKFARGRHADGSWIVPFDPGKPASFVTEGLPFQYTFFVPQDMPGLIALEGGNAPFVARLDELFAKDYYDHGNEPSHAITYLYDYAGAAWKTQQHVSDIRAQWYQDRPDGLAGNDDAGQMSAWYVLSALGFYPVTPGIPAYEIGTPLLPSATLHLENGNTFRIRAENAGPQNIYIQSVTLNGRPLERFWIRHADILAGGQLTFRMGPQPNPHWPSSAELPH